MTTPEKIARRFDNRSGYRLVSYGPVGLPLYRLTAIGVCLETKSLDPIEEFVLRSVMAGAESADQCAGLLGLEWSVIESCLAELIRTECIKVLPGSMTIGARKIRLTSKGEELARAQETVVPVEQTIVFYFDGLVRKPRFYPTEYLHEPRHLRDFGIPEVRAFPARAPELEEINLNDVIDIIRLDAGRAESPRQLLRIQTIERRQRTFLEAVALAYRAESGSDIQVAFAVDGRLSIEHEQAFARAKGIEKTNLFRGLSERAVTPSIIDLLGQDLSEQVALAAQAGRNKEGIHNIIQLPRARPHAVFPNSLPTPTEHEAAAESGLNEADEQHSGQTVVRPLAVYEHAPLLKRALKESKERLLIVSPWIRRSVVTASFVKSLQQALDRGVSIFIGYGLGEDDEERPADKDARKELEQIARQSDRFAFKRFGDTHAKVLIKDSDFFVISSFNWLSFRGDSRKAFREEWGTLVSVAHVVEEYFQRMVVRFRE